MEIQSLDELDAHLAAHAGDPQPLAGTRLQSLDLTKRADTLLNLDPHGAVVLGGLLTPELEHHLRLGHAVIFPVVDDCPVDVYRAHLYRPQELFDDLATGYDSTPDARAYAWSLDTAASHDALATLLRAMHDDVMSDALTEAVAGRSCVGVMGGHAVQRGSDGYASAARLGRVLAEAGLVVLTGGGPGAMEAASLGALSAGHPGADLDAALVELAGVPSFTDVVAWAQLGLDVRARLGEPDTLVSVGIPTWFYGHEPPNPFAQWHAKYFSNAVREDTLLSRANAGIVYQQGAAGTVQELFQAVTPGFYSDTGGVPLVLVGREQWTQKVPVWQPLQALADGRALQRRLHLVDDDPAQVLAALDL